MLVQEYGWEVCNEEVVELVGLIVEKLKFVVKLVKVLGLMEWFIGKDGDIIFGVRF